MNTVFWKTVSQSNREHAEYRGQQEVFALVHVVERPITVHYDTQTKALYLEKSD